MRLVTVIVSVVGIALSGAATAQPTLQGHYLLQLMRICPLLVTYTQSTTIDAVASITGGVGTAYSDNYLIKFSRGSFTGSGFHTAVDVAIVGSEAQNVVNQAMSGGGSYSNTDTSLTLSFGGGSAQTYNIVYGNVANGIVYSALLSGTSVESSGPTCILSGSLLRRSVS
ncbi:MAG TPA: hypothetical protein VKS60_04840 [Stellaceae bacterium]|nr:hypothetical protein [Stellaceae bacterium]